MANTKYAFQGMKENMAKAMKKDVESSMKVAIEISSFIKGRTTEEAKKILGRVLEMKQAIPYRKFNDGVGHRKGAGIAAGRFPQKASSIFIELIESAEANAQTKGLSSNLKIIHLAPQKSSGAYHYGRLRRRKFKRVHLEIVVEEIDKESTDKSKKVKQEKHNQVEKHETSKHETPNVEQNVEEIEQEKLEEKKIESQPKKPKKKAPAKKSQEDKQ